MKISHFHVKFWPGPVALMSAQAAPLGREWAPQHLPQPQLERLLESQF